jgi:hypothetical protein
MIELNRIYNKDCLEMTNIKYTCLLGKKVAKCSPTENCKHCGWEKSERERRKAYMAAHGFSGLTLCEDGIWRLDLSKIERNND